MEASKGVRETMLVNVKLAPGIDARRSASILARAPGVVNVTQTFPGESDRDLASLYLIEVDTDTLNTALSQFRNNPDVEYAEEAAPRKLIR